MNKQAILALIDALIDDRLQGESLRGIRGPKGLRGSPGKDFDFQEHSQEIKDIISDEVNKNSDSYRLKFSDLSNEEKSSLKFKFADFTKDELDLIRGPRGMRGQKGKSVHFEDIKEDLYNQLQTIFDGEKHSFKLSFDDLTSEEKDSLKLKFSDLSDIDLESITGPKGEDGIDGKRGLRGEKGADGEKGEQGLPGKDGEKGEQGDRGPRGMRGQKGRQGPQGEKGEAGIRGARGPIGPQGFSGKDGSNGVDGRDAPFITDVFLDLDNNRLRFVFEFNNGTSIQTNFIELPSVKKFISSCVAYGVGDGGGGLSSITIKKDGNELGQVDTLNFEDNIEVSITDSEATISAQGQCVEIFDEGVSRTDCVKSINFIGDLVTVQSTTKIADWNTLSEVDSIGNYTVGDPQNIEVVIQQPNPSNVVLFNVSCLADVYVGSAVIMTPGEVAQLALANSAATSNVIGIVENKPSATLCDIRVLGVSAQIFVGLDLTKSYFLSATVPGGVTNTPPSIGNFRVKLGKPFSDTKLLTQIGEVEELSI